MIIRSNYMNTLKTYRDVPLVKILAGIRRCGKSTILDMLRDDLLESGVAADHIISMRYTSEDFDDGMTDKDLYNGIKRQMTMKGATTFCWMKYRKSKVGKKRSIVCWRMPTLIFM